ncbi:MAG: carboxypeptidase regulatory-like domain-containing protein [Acidobacteria bacterium]|nr:carboxypeptidase regulatory-like domain-containing protein [Acidobacteriota bacterium]
MRRSFVSRVSSLVLVLVSYTAAAQDSVAPEPGKPVPVDHGKPSEITMRRAASPTIDLRLLPQTGPAKFERPERAEPATTRVELPGRTGGAAGPSVPPRNAPAPPPTQSFDGLDFANFGAGHPPDTNGDVGPTYYIQSVNTSLGIYNKSTGARVAAFTFNTFMSQGAFGNLCDTNNFGDPVVLYDSFEDRWVITDFAFTLDGSNNVVNPPGAFQCFAVSKTGDPVAGGWNYYSVQLTDGLNDYPKFGIWPDGIYMSANMFGFPAGASFMGTRVWALNKAQMYAGAPAVQIVSFRPPASDFTLLPSNARLQAGTPPPGTPNYFVSSWQFLNALTVYKFHVDWDRISLSTFTGPDTPLAATSWPNANVPNAPSLGGNSLDVLPIRAMMQNQYSNVGGAESLWAAHTVRRADTSGFAAPRWYQVNVTGGTVAASLPQAATWDPDAANVLHRFMPSLAIDRAGNMALGYSTSSSTTKPAIMYAGRLASDPVNTLGQTEQLLIQGAGTQTGNCGGAPCARWGDYSAMTLDPNGCSFWYTNEYYAVDGLNDLTRIGSFAFPGCTPVGSGTLQGVVTAAVGGAPLAGATVTLGSRTAIADGTGTYAFIGIPAGTYPILTAATAGYVTGAATAVAVADGGTATQNFSLAAAPASACPADTTQADFQRGVPTNVDLDTSAGDVTLSNAPLLDQSNTAGTSTGTSFATASWGGQTFVPAVTGQLAQVTVHLFCSGCTGTTPNLTLSVRATSGGLPTGGDLATATLAGFSSGAGLQYTVSFGSPATLTSGTQYALILRPVANPSVGGYFWIRSSPSTYANGQRVISTDNGATFTADSTRDFNFKTYMQTGYAAAGTLVSGLFDSNPAAGRTTNWGTFSFTETTPASTAAKFQVAASNSAFGPFSFVGPDGTAATFFTTSGASLAQFNGKRYLQYKAYLSTSDSTATPTLSDVTVCFTDVCVPLPTPTITPGGPTTFCAGGSVTLNSSSAAGNQWYLNGNPIGGATSQAYAATASGSYTVVVTTAGCTSAASAATAVTVNPIPATPTITPGGPTTFCIGGSVFLTSSAASGNQWSRDGNPIGGATGQTYEAAVSGTYTVVTTASGCASAASAGTTVTVKPAPSTPIVTAPASVVANASGYAASVPLNPGSTYAWTISNGAITSSTTLPTITFSAGPPGTLTLTCVETGSNGCVSNGGSVTIPVTGTGFHEITPCRVLDTRNATGAYGGPAIAPGVPRTFVATNRCGVPATARALSVNVTATAGTSSGGIRVFPAGIADPNLATVNYGANQTRANNALVSLGAGGDFTIATGQATGTVHVIVDVNGWFE